MGRAHHRTVDRVSALLEAAVLHPQGASLTGLARHVGAPVSSVQKLVDGLVAVGFLAERDRTYTLGPAPSVLSLRAGRPPLRAVRHDDLVALHEATGVPVLLAVRLGDAAVYVDWAGAGEAFDYAVSSRIRTPLRATAAGRVLLAHAPEGERRGLVVASLDGGGLDGGGGEDGAAGVVAALAEGAAIRRDGRVRGASGPLVPDAAAVAVPVREGGDRPGSVVAAVVATAPLDAPDDVLDAAGDALAAAAATWAARPG